MSYVELHCHSNFSFLDGASQPEELIEQAARLGYPALALTDHDGFYGIIRFNQAAKEHGVRAIFGAEIILEDGYHLVLLVKDGTGYANLSHLLSVAQLANKKAEARVTYKMLEAHTDGLIALSGCQRGEVAARLMQERLSSEFTPRFAGLEAAQNESKRASTSLRAAANDCSFIGASGHASSDAARRSELRPDATPEGEALPPLETPFDFAQGGAPPSLRSPLVCARGGASRMDFARAQRTGTVQQTTPDASSRASERGTSGSTESAIAAARRYREIFGEGNFYLEMQHHNLPIHEKLCREMMKLSKQTGIPLVATNNVHFAVPTDRKIQDVLTCIKNHTTLDQADAFLYPNAERYLKTARQMKTRFAFCPEAISNTLAIAARCDFSLGRLKTSLPDFPVPIGETVNSYLRRLTYEGAKRRYGQITDVITRQLEHELGLIAKLDLSGYFLIVWDICRFCMESGILSQGRGSAANSAVCYCLGITAVDPIGLKLLFERFISEERTEPPDIDIDIANNRREEAIQYVYTKYGRQHAAMVCEVISYRGRSAVRDVGKALGFSLDEVDKLAKHLGHWSDPEEVRARISEAGLNADNKRVRLLVELCQRIHRFPRHLGIHVGGMIITKKPLSEIVPIENASMPDRSVIQWDKDDCGDAGMVKIDLLGLGMLSLIDYALQLVKRHKGVTIDPAKLKYDDPKIFDLLCAGETVGVFQVESRAQMNCLPRHKPRRFYDLVVEVALIRPGPIQGDMVHPYLRRRNGEEPITYPHPILEPVLERTLGIPLFQEQGMQVAMLAAGFTPSQADELRRAMGHKRSHEKMEALKNRLIMGMLKNGISEEAATRIFQQLSAFADFGFAESHAASFALLVYVSTYLKVYYPHEFYCALLNAQPMGFYSPSTIIYEAKRRGMTILPIDISRSEWDCTIENNAVRLGFRYVKGLGDAAKEVIEAARTAQPFGSIEDFVFRTRLERDSLEQLALVGAFDCFGVERRQALWEMLALANQTSEEMRLRAEASAQVDLPVMKVGEQLAADFKGMDLSTGPHPMTLVRERLKAQGVQTSAEIAKVANYKLVTVAGVVVIRQRPVTAKGFLFITMEDETGFINIVVKPKMLEKYRKTLIFYGGLIVKGQLEKKDGVINVIGHKFEPLLMTEAKVRSRDFR